MLLHCERRGGADEGGASLAGDWLSAGVLDSLSELNELCLALLAEQAALCSGPASGLLRQVGELTQVAPLQRIQDQKQGGNEREQNGQKPGNRHLRSSQAFCLGTLGGLSGALLFRLVAPCTEEASISQGGPRPVGISPYLVAGRLGSAPENP